MKKIDLATVIFFPLVIFVSVFYFGLQITYLQSLILVFAIPSIYLSFRAVEKIKKVAWFSLLVSIPVAIIVELISFWDHAWIVPHSSFSFRIFGFSPIENYIWQFLTVYTILIFYEHFCNNKFQSIISKKIWVMNLILYSLAFISIDPIYVRKLHTPHFVSIHLVLYTFFHRADCHISFKISKIFYKLSQSPIILSIHSSHL